MACVKILMSQYLGIRKLSENRVFHLQFSSRCFSFSSSVNFPVKNLELKDFIPLPTPKENEKLRSKYDLISNIVHDGKPGEGSYRVFVQRKSEELW